jgi:hypothetical protein
MTPKQVALHLNFKVGDKIARLEKNQNPRSFRITAIGEELVIGRETTQKVMGAAEKPIPLGDIEEGVTWVSRGSIVVPPPVQTKVLKSKKSQQIVVS